MFRLLMPLFAVGLSACGGGSTTDPNNFIISTPTGTPLTATQAKSFAQASAGAPYTIGGGASSFTLERTNQSTAHQSTYDLTVNGVTYNLTPVAGNSATSSNNSFSGTVGGTTATLFLNENMPNASIANVQLGTGTSSQELFGIVGSATPTSTLASIASANYSGIGEISIDRANGSFDDAQNATVSMAVDFTGGTLSGSFNVVDPVGSGAGDSGSGPIDINGSATLPLTGTVSGNTFTGTVDYTNLVGITTGVSSITGQPINGGFFGTNAENAVGVGVSLGQSAVANDVVVYTRIQATKN